MNVCFKRIKKIAEVSLSDHSRKGEIHFAFSVFLVRHIISSFFLKKLTLPND